MALPTKKISQLPVGSLPLSGNELMEISQVGVSNRITTRSFVLPTDSLITLSGMGGSLPGSRQLVSSPTVQVSDGGPGGQVSLVALGGLAAFTGLQQFVAAAGNNNDVPLDPFIGFLDVDTTAGVAAITGIVATSDGQILTISNTGANLLTLPSGDVLSDPANRFRFSSTIGIVPNGSYTVRYCVALGLWVAMS